MARRSLKRALMGWGDGPRRPQIERNPVVPRMRHIASRYPLNVLRAVAFAWAEANGIHNQRARYEIGALDGRSGFGVSTKDELLDVLGRLTPASSPYDRYIPWLAGAFAETQAGMDAAVGKALAAEAIASGGPAPSPELVRDYIALTLIANADQVESSPHQYVGGPEFNPWYDQWINLGLRFRAIVDWAKAKRVDLNKVDAPTALAEAEQFAPEGTATPGTTVYKWDDGWTVQELTTKGQLSSEGDLMQHCVDTYQVLPGGIENQYSHTRVRIFSLRDEKNRPHATLEWNDGRAYGVTQLRGKQNAVPQRDYLLRMAAFRRDYLDPETYAWLEGSPSRFSSAHDVWDRWLRGHLHQAKISAVTRTRGGGRRLSAADEMTRWLTDLHLEPRDLDGARGELAQ